MQTPASEAMNQSVEDHRKRWQGTSSGAVATAAFLGVRGLAIWAGMLLSAAAMFSLLIWMLLFAPQRTPMLVVGAGNYQRPFPPNAWAGEDIEKLGLLDGQTLTMQGSESTVLTANDFWQQIDKQLNSAAESANQQPQVFWISMHGVADQQSDAIQLVPPQSSPVSRSDWIDLKRLLQRLDDSAAADRTLLILDCSRIESNWSMGLKSNAFVEKTKQFVQSGALKHLTVMMPAEQGQTSNVSADLKASVFGHYLQLALAGAADRYDETGNRDDWVSVSELHAFVRRHVNRWAMANRGVPQEPILLTGHAASDFHVARAMNQDTLQELIRERFQSKRLVSTIPASQLDALWSQLEQFREEKLYQAEPIAFADVEQELLWLEKLCLAGKQYQTLAEKTLESVSTKMRQTKRRAAQQKLSPTLALTRSVISGRTTSLPPFTHAHTLPLSILLGTISESDSLQVRDRLAEFTANPTQAAMGEIVQAISDATTDELAVTRFLRMTDRYQTPSERPQPEQLRRLFTIQSQIRERSTPMNAGSELRFHHWVRAAMPPLDFARREMEDHFLADDPIENDLAITEKQYQLVNSILDDLREAVQTSDLAMSQLVYLAKWANEMPPTAANDEGTPSIRTLLSSLIADVQQLTQRIDRGPTETDPMMIAEQARQLKEDSADKVAMPLEVLRRAVDLQISRIQKTPTPRTPQQLVAIRSLLSLPVITSKKRSALRAAFSESSAEIQEAFHRGETVPAQTVSQSNATSETANQLESKPALRHPLEMLLDCNENDQITEEHRGGIERFLTFVESELAESDSKDSIAESHAPCDNACRRVRAVAPLISKTLRRNPIDDQCLIELQSLIVWSGERAIDDFWGPAGQKQAYFDLVASNCLDIAAELAELRSHSNPTETSAIEIDHLSERLKAGRRLAIDWIQTASRPAIQLGPDEGATASVVLANGMAPDDFHAPGGTAKVIVKSAANSDSAGESGSALIEASDSFELPILGTEVSLKLPPRSANDRSTLQAQTIFRGHEYNGDLDVQQLGGIKVDVRPYRYKKSEVSLSNAAKDLAVTFVLDCSASMGDPLSGAAEKSSRLEVAKTALQELLLELGMRSNIRVGVRFFGHRVGWGTDQAGQLLKRPDLSDVPAGLTPSQDIETILPLGNFTLSEAQLAIAKVSGVQAWGQSPLYLSLVQSINEFPSNPVESTQQIVVVTDGANYQFIPPDVPESETRVSNVREAWQKRQIPISILGLDMNAANDSATVEEFTRLCTETGGRFTALKRSTDLKQTLKDLLNPGVYHLRHPEGLTVEQTAELGRAIRVLPAPTSPTPFRVDYQTDPATDDSATEGHEVISEEVVLEGGEFLQLFVDPTQNTIQAYPYISNVVAQDALVTANGIATGRVVRLHRPYRGHPDTVAFPVSWQRQDDRVGMTSSLWRTTRRPSNVWVEIEPVTADGTAHDSLFTFYDANFEPRLSVPRIDFTAQGWPRECTQARVRVWTRTATNSDDLQLAAPDKTPTSSSGISKQISLQQVRATPQRVAPGVMLRADSPLAPTDSTAIATTRVRLVLEFDEHTEPVSSWKLSLPGTHPDRIVRQFDQEHQIAVHTFEFADARVKESTEIRITNRAHELNGTWQTTIDAFEVNVAEQSDFLRVGRLPR